MKTNPTVRTILRTMGVWGIALAAWGLCSPAQEVFREFPIDYGASPKKIFGELELHPTSKSTTSGSWAIRPRQVPSESLRSCRPHLLRRGARFRSCTMFFHSEYRREAAIRL